MNTLALDLGTVTGWAVALGKTATISGTQNLKPSRFESSGTRFLKLVALLERLYESTPLDLVVVEEVRRHAGTDAAHVYGGLLAHVQTWCENRGVEYRSESVGTIKQFITGKGNAPKDAVMAAVRAIGYEPADDNEADAIALLHLTLSKMA